MKRFICTVCDYVHDGDAMPDTAHEMCKDEARHGLMLAGLLRRYFQE